MINIIWTYLNQRFSVLIFGALSLYLITFSIPEFYPEAVYFYLFFGPAIFFALLGFRIVDDLMSIEEDRGKDRIHTEKRTQLPLIVLSVVAFSIAGYILDVFSFSNFKWLVLFFGVCMFPYLIFSPFKNLKFIAPLVKYPSILLVLIITIAKTADWIAIVASISLLLAFISFELLQDQSLNKFKSGIIFTIPSIAGVYVLEVNVVLWLLLTGIGVIAALLLKKYDLKIAPYLVLLFGLIVKILAYGI